MLFRGTVAATVAYLFAGIFGYTTFAANPDVSAIMNEQNILKGEYHGNVWIYICLFGILVVILFATPLTLLPCKDTVEELFLKNGAKLNNWQNIVTTFVLVVISFGISILIPNIGDAMTILGATTNTFIGFLMPIIYYLKIERHAPASAPHKVVAYIVFIVVSCCSVIEILTFIYKKVNPDAN